MLEERVIQSLESLNGGLLKPKAEITFEVASNILNDILNNAYRKEKYFLNEKYEKTPAESKKEIADHKEYQVFRICAVTPFSDTISINLGGIVYDDPAVAITVALNVNQNKSVLPIAKNYDTYKALLQKTEVSLKKANLKLDFFEKAKTFFKPSNFDYESKPQFDVITIKGEDLKRLYEKGCASFLHDDDVKFFEFYKNPDFS